MFYGVVNRLTNFFVVLAACVPSRRCVDIVWLNRVGQNHLLDN